MKHIKIATDISSSDSGKVTTWACFIWHDGGVIKHVEEFDQYYKQTTHAEVYGLINALIIARNNIPGWENSKLTIYNEIEYALTPIRTKAGNIRLRDKERAEAIMGIAYPLLGQAGDWELVDIKAHYKDWEKSPMRNAYIMNRWCDSEARRLLKTIRNSKQKRACA